MSRLLCALIFLSGFASLSWEVVWQVKASLALGVSAWGTAITLAVTMGGMSAGGFLMGRALKKTAISPVRVYGVLECIIGFAGLMLNIAFRALESLDSWAYGEMPGGASLVHMLGIAAVLGIPAFCMGATLPVFGLIARQHGLSIASLYGLNTYGAAAGVLFAAFVLIPLWGIAHTIAIIAALNVTVGLAAWFLFADRPAIAALPPAEPPELPTAWKTLWFVFVTGFATFVLEIAWFRSLASTFDNNTDVFAIMLACVLIALAMASRQVPRLKHKNASLPAQLCMAGILILLATPIIERFDMLTHGSHTPADQVSAAADRNAPVKPPLELVDPDTFATSHAAFLLYAYISLVRFIVMLFVLAPAMLYLGVVFPWVLDDQQSPRAMGRLYAVNTLAAIAGALGAAWILLPAIGFARTSWIAGILVAITGIATVRDNRRMLWSAAAIAALFVAVWFETGIGTLRAQGYYANIEGAPARVVDFFEGPDATVSVVEYRDGGRRLLINSASASGQSGTDIDQGEYYMAWMGYLPMLLHPDPKNALVICFGTGQTANAVRKENPELLDIVDVNARIFRFAPHFRSNEGVLNDPRVSAIVMDGRAWLRRTGTMYDVITLEPMPPTAAGVNALYSREFYELARSRLRPGGIIAQWLPLHWVAPHYAASIARTFTEVFPNAILWIAPGAKNDGILLGTADTGTELAAEWPGFARKGLTRSLPPKDIERYAVLTPHELIQYGAYGEIITDDNQLLAYGKALYSPAGLDQQNHRLLQHINQTDIPDKR